MFGMLQRAERTPNSASSGNESGRLGWVADKPLGVFAPKQVISNFW
jgi:hypothetical protein